MSQTNQPNPADEPNQPSQPTKPRQSSRSSLRTLGIVGLVVIAILSLAFAGYTAQNPRVTTVTQQQLLTNTQSLTNTLTVTNTKTATSATTITSTSVSTASIGYGYGYGNGYGYGYNPYYPYYPYPNYQNCGASCPPSSNYLNNYNACNLNNGMGSNKTFQCFGYIYQDSGGCTELAVPMPNPPYYFENPVIHYYGLQNLPSNLPPMGSWVTVTGQWNQGPNTSTSGAACPINYLNVTSIAQ